MAEHYLMGHVCVKANGHTAWRGERDFGACGSHYEADIVIIPHERVSRDVDWEAVALSQGERENYLEDLEWEAESMREKLAKIAQVLDVDAVIAKVDAGEYSDPSYS